jgi:hypothetical protein
MIGSAKIKGTGMHFLLRFLGYFLLWAVFGSIAAAFMISFMFMYAWAFPITSAMDIGKLDFMSIVLWVALLSGLVGGVVKASGWTWPVKPTEE